MKARLIIGLSVAAGLALLIIGIRFLVVPQQAARFFGVGATPASFELHRIIALRDIWLALMLIGLAALREWRALALCLGLGALVCLGDSLIVLASTAWPGPIAFHLASGAYCGVVAWAAWLRSASP